MFSYFFAFMLPCFIVLMSKEIYAADFAVDRQITYTVSQDLTTSVQEKLTIENLTTEKYASRYTTSLSQTKIWEPAAIDSQGMPLQVQQKTSWIESSQITEIIITFPEPVVGKNQARNFTLTYDLPDTVENKGRIYQIHLPKLIPNKMERQIFISLSVHRDLGKLAYINPQPESQQTVNQQWQTFIIPSSGIKTTGIRAVFGDFQLYDFQLNFHLSPGTKTQTIALPPDTDYQRVAITKIDPMPQQITTDPDLNWLAHYQISHPKTITVKGTAMILAFPWKTNYLSQPQLWTEPQTYWETQHPAIMQLTEQNQTPEQINHFIINKLKYNYPKFNQPVIRRGAVNSLQSPEQSICTEFTDLFIAIARANRIPARRAVGYAYSDNPQLKPLSLFADILHTWPEFWDDQTKTWHPIDPTWSVTSGFDYFNTWDYNHFTLVNNGLNSQYPLPAGFYKSTNNPKPDISVTIGQNFPNQIPEIKPRLQIKLPWWPFGWIPANIVVVNLGPTAVYQLEPGYPPTQTPVMSTADQKLQVLAPYAEHQFSISIKPQPFKFNQTITLKLLDQIQILPLPWFIPIWQGIITLIILLITTVTLRKILTF